MAAVPRAMPGPPVGGDAIAELMGNMPRNGPDRPDLPAASPLDIAHPLGTGPEQTPSLTTPFPTAADRGQAQPSMPEMFPFPGRPQTGSAPSNAPFGGIGGLGAVDQWAWEMGSEAPSNWTGATSMRSSAAQSRISSQLAAPQGDGLIPGLTEGQRLKGVKPKEVSATAGGRIVVTLNKAVPQGYWNHVQIAMVPTSAGSEDMRRNLKPTGVKKGKKLCLEVPAGMTSGDYDLRLIISAYYVPGSLVLSISDEISDEEQSDHEGFTPLQS